MNIVTGYAGKAHITSDRVRNFNAAIVGNGKYVMDLGAKFGYEVISNNLIRINNGHLMNQGTHACIDINDYEEMTIDNGLQGVKRNDLIVAKYEKNVVTGIEKVSLVVIKGTSGEAAVDPEYVTGDILNGAVEDDMLLYRVCIEGLSIVAVEPLFEVFNNADELVNALKKLMDEKIAALESTDESLIQAINQAAKIWMVDDNELHTYIYDMGEPKTSKYPISKYYGADTYYVDVLTGKAYQVELVLEANGGEHKEWQHVKTLTSVQEELATAQSELNAIGTIQSSSIAGSCPASAHTGLGSITIEEAGTYFVEINVGGLNPSLFTNLAIGVINPGTTTQAYARNRRYTNNIQAVISLVKGAVVKAYVNPTSTLEVTGDTAYFYLRATRIS